MSEVLRRRSAVAALLVMGCTLFSRVLGFIRTATIGALFGAGGAADVINLIFNIPNNLRKLMAEGALSTAFIPELSRRIIESPQRDSPVRLVQGILGIQSAIILPVLLLSLVFPEKVLTIFENFADPAKRELSITLFRWIMPYLFFVSISAVMMAVHNTHDWFFVPAITPVIFSICVITSLLLGYERWGAVAVGFGVLIGGIAQIMVQFPSYQRLGYRLQPRWSLYEPGLRLVMKRWIPMLLISSLFAINNQIAMLLASFLPDKSTSALAYAIVFFQLPFGIFSASINTVLYPKMSRQAVRGERAALIESLEFGYRNLWAFLLPSAIGLIILGEPLVAVAFQRRAFSAADAQLTAQVLAAYAVGMPFLGIFNITQRGFYALGESKKPFYCALATIGLDIALSVFFVFVLDSGPQALAWANSLAFIVGAVIQYAVFRRQMGMRLSTKTRMTFAQVCLATAVGLSFMLIGLHITGREWWLNGSSWKSLVILVAIAGTAAISILGMYLWMKVEALSIFFRRTQ